MQEWKVKAQGLELLILIAKGLIIIIQTLIFQIQLFWHTNTKIPDQLTPFAFPITTFFTIFTHFSRLHKKTVQFLFQESLNLTFFLLI